MAKGGGRSQSLDRRDASARWGFARTGMQWRFSSNRMRYIGGANVQPRRVARRGRRVAPLGEAIERGREGRIVDRGEESREEFVGVGRQFRPEGVEPIGDGPGASDPYALG